LNDKQRKNPPAIGSIITYRFQELTKDGVPRYAFRCFFIIDSKNLLHCRFPTFVGIAADKNQPKDAEVPEHKLQNGIPKDDDDT